MDDKCALLEIGDRVAESARVGQPKGLTRTRGVDDKCASLEIGDRVA
ncbi:MAG: hypothetical protein HZB43_11905 [candidate division Zixibacteria bacterium]|nr:hypothetical protein [candidate division Zixibacteria bacterium]